MLFAHFYIDFSHLKMQPKGLVPIVRPGRVNDEVNNNYGQGNGARQTVTEGWRIENRLGMIVLLILKLSLKTAWESFCVTVREVVG